jgi:hypothetical protein
MCGAFECSSMIITLIFLFWALLKWAEAAGTGGADVGDGSHPEEAIDAEVAWIASEVVMDLEGPTAMDTVADILLDGTD